MTAEIIQLTGPSPLAEADPESLDILFDRVNQKLAAGLPEEISDEMLAPLVASLWKKRNDYVMNGEQKVKKPKAEGGTKRTKPVTSVREALASTEFSAEDFT